MGNLTTYYPPVQWEKKESGYEYRHDFLERVVDTISPLQEHHRVFRNFDGDITSRIHPVSYALKGEEGEGTRYEYNGHGQILREVDGEGKEVLYTYNDLGWKIRERIKVQETDPALYRVIAYTYDSQGNKVEEAYGQQEVERDGEPDGWHRIHFSYDKNNHLNVVKDDFGAKMRYDYDCLGNVTLEERAIADGVHSVIHYAYNKNGCVDETSYGKSTLNSLKNTENFTDSAIEHIFEGQVNARGKAVGYHYEGIEGTSGNVIPGTESSVNNIGIYKAKVEVNGIPKTANGGFSSFYPKSMSPQEVIGSINEAYRNRVYIRGNTYSGLTSSGMEIEMFLDKNGKIISAYPVY